MRATDPARILLYMRAFLRWLFGPGLIDPHEISEAFRTLEDRIVRLERQEQERDRATAEQLDQLRRYWKRFNTRRARDGDLDDDADDEPITKELLRRKLHLSGE